MGAIVAAGGVLLPAIGAPGQECALTLKRLESTSRYTPAEYQFRATYPQTVHAQFQDPKGRVRFQIGSAEETEKAFKRIVKKEPAKYGCEHPFRGIVKLGAQEFAFVFDAVGAKPEEKEAEKAESARKKEEQARKEQAKKTSSLLDSLSRALSPGQSEPDAAEARRPGKAIVYSRLYFDLNHNGDLTDDKVIEAETSDSRVFSRSMEYAQARFPVVTVPLEAGGTKYEYAFSVYVTYQAIEEGTGYAYASFSAAAYREGEITLEGKKRRVALVDFNSNGRYDDVMTIRDDVRGRVGEIYPQYGDILLLDPQPDLPVFMNPYDVTSSGNRYNVSKLVSIDGKFYDLTISPAGEKLSLKPATPSIGYVTNPNEGFTAVVYGDKGFVKISGGKSKPVPLPEGTWTLLSYTIDQTGMEEKSKPANKKDEPGQKSKEGQGLSDLLSVVARALGGGVASSSPAMPLRFTRVSAQATRDCKPIEVRKGQTVALPFGPPYKPVVRVDFAQSPELVRLGMTLVGSAGERCSDMMVRGSRPSRPDFTISNPKGEIVYRGSFEYG
jgi:hypothetical protein